MNSKEKPGALDMYISSLSIEEREKYKEIIEEFRERDARIRTNCEEAQLAIQKLGDIELKLMGQLKELEIASKQLLKNTSSLYLTLIDKNKMHS